MTPDLVLGIAIGALATLAIAWFTLRDVNLHARLPPTARELPPALPLQLARARQLRLVASDGRLAVPPAREDFEPPRAA